MSLFSTTNSGLLFSSKSINTQTSKSGTTQNLSGGMTGSIPYQSATNKTTFLNPGLTAENSFLQLQNGLPSWSSNVVTLNTDQEITGNKTFTNNISYTANSYKSTDLVDLTDITGQYNLVPKKYVDQDYDNTPPPVQFGSIYSTSSDIYIPIIYPTQTYRGTCPQPIPTILGCIFTIDLINTTTTPNTVSSTKTIDSTITPFDPNYVWPLSTTDEYKLVRTPLTGIIISKTKTTTPATGPTMQDFYTSNSNISQRRCFIYNLTNVIDGSYKIKITGNYINYVNGSVLVSKDSITYSDGYAPSNITQTTSTNVTNNSATINITKPTYTNYNPTTQDNDNNSIIITKYTYGYSTPGSTYRYNSKVPQTVSNIDILNPVSTVHSLSLTSLYPDSPYTFNINSTNSINKTSAGVTFANLFATTNLLPVIDATVNHIENATISLQNATIQAKDLNGILRDVLNNTTGSSITITCSNTTPLSINYNSASRGNLGSNATKLMSLESKINSLPSVTKNLKSFPIGSQEAASNANLTITPDAIQDQYSDNYKQGFYSKVPSFTVTMQSTSLTNGLNILTINQMYYAIDGATPVGTTRSKTRDIHYDNLVNNPSFGTITFALTTPISNYMKQISGVWVLYTTPVITVSAVVNDLYNSYYVNGNLLTYTFTNGCTGETYETNLNNYTLSNKTFLRTNLNPPINSSFKKDISLTLKAINIKDTTSSSPQTIPIICDPLSNTLLTTAVKNPTSIQSVTTTEIQGFRVWTNPGSSIVISNGSATYIPSDYGSSTNTVSYSHSTNTYSHSNDILGGTYIQELQIADGKYRSGTSSNNAYLDYRTYNNNNTLNYSTVSKTNIDYRFATFAWKYVASSLSSTITSFVFTFKNFLPNTTVIPIATFNQSIVTGSYSFNSDNRFFLHYRVEDEKSIAPTTSTVINSYSTIWVDGNSKFGTTLNVSTPVLQNESFQQINTSNYNTPLNTVRAPTAVQYTFSGSDLVATVSSIWYGNLGTSFKVYCRFGLPMNNNYSFDYVTLRFKID